MALRLHTHSEQLAAHLKSELLKGRWSDTMPGILNLETELGVNRNTIHAALLLLENEGLLESGGAGRPRRIVLPDNFKAPSQRIVILLYEDADRTSHYMVELRHAIHEAGHTAEFARKTLRDLGMNVKRVAGFVSKTNADAWVIKSGSREILEWFSEHPKPAFAFFGRRRQVPLASTGPDKTDACAAAVRRLAELGHKRIVMLVREERRKPKPGALEQRLLDELKALGIPSGPYNLPDWQDNAADFHKCLDSLFKHTPPTALFIDEVPMFLAAQHYLAQRGIVAPRDVSMVCMDSEPGFAWFQPSISHIHWSPEPMVRQVVEWTNKVARGRDDRNKRQFKAEFVEGGTIGPARM
jgi:DNA-binding LacI/PurR family transcriptional regulator